MLEFAFLTPCKSRACLIADLWQYTFHEYLDMGSNYWGVLLKILRNFCWSMLYVPLPFVWTGGFNFWIVFQGCVSFSCRFVPELTYWGLFTMNGCCAQSRCEYFSALFSVLSDSPLLILHAHSVFIQHVKASGHDHMNQGEYYSTQQNEIWSGL